jgi:hypothetical protein
MAHKGERIVVPKFKTEPEEAQWWYDNREKVEDALIHAMDSGTIHRGTPQRLTTEARASRSVTTRIKGAEMKTAILHLSDIHIDHARHPILKRADRIARAVASSGHAIRHIIVVVTGDVAWSGTKAEYNLARTFFDDLSTRLKELTEGADLSYVFVPGNHDCDLTTASDVRQQDVIETKLPGLDLNGDLATHFVAVQAEFFQFTCPYEGESFTSTPAQLCHSRTVRSGDATLRFCCFNTAWLTQNPERPSRLYFPMTALTNLAGESTHDLTISIFHHPFNWLNPTNAQEFKNAVEGMSDLMLSGHEHTADLYSKRRTSEDIVHCLEADALWEPRARTSAFNLLLFDFPAGKYCVTAFQWNEGTYEPKALKNWETFERNLAARSHAFENNLTFKQELNDLGTGFSHRQSLKDLTLRDLFVYPDLIRRLFEVRTAETRQNRIRSHAVLDFIWEHDSVLIVGEAKSGKTALAKCLYVDLQRKGLIPVLISGEQLRGGQEARVLSGIHHSYAEQYSTDTLELYKQTDKKDRVLIVDDLHRSKLSVTEQFDAIAVLHRVSERVIIFVDESSFQISEIASKGPSRPFATYAQCELFPFCPSLRRKLISRWVELGADNDTSPEQQAHEIRARERILEMFLPKQSLPPFPINILGLLQAYETSTNLNTANGSYGELCESLITQRLLQSGKKKPTDIPTKYTFLSRLAYFMFHNEQVTLSPQDLVALRQEYFKEFDVEVEPSIMDDLMKAQLVTCNDGNYRFRYPSYYYFFTARYFKDAIADPIEAPAVRAVMNRIADHLYYEPYVNILIFYLYFTHDVTTIEHILNNTKVIYGEYPICALEGEVDFLNRLYVENPKPILICEADIYEHRERHGDQIDEEEVYAPVEAIDDGDRDVAYDESLDHLKKMNIAFKTLQVLGQALRNFPNVLKADLKTRVALECYSLGLRVLSAVLAISEDNLEGLREYLATIIKEQREIELDRELARETDTFMIRLIGGCTYGLIRRVSGAVGSEELAETYRNVLRRQDNKPSVALIDLSIKLDHFSTFPMTEIEQITKQVRHSNFCYSILRELVLNNVVQKDIGLESRRRVSRVLLIEVGEITDGVKFLT